MHIEILSAATDMIFDNVIIIGVAWQADMSFGKEESFFRFFRNDVFPTIESKYEIDSKSRTYFGYSAGALFGAYILSSEPESFKHYLLGSPALKNSPEVKQKVFELLYNSMNKSLNAKVFISYGTMEEEAGQHIEEFISMLENRNDESLLLNKVIVKGNHQTAFPMTGVLSIQWLAGLMKE